MPEPMVRDSIRLQSGPPVARDENYELAVRELEGLVKVLEGEGVTVRRPDRIDNARPYVTPDFVSAAGLGQSCPRDVLIVVGDEILEAPMSNRQRYFEFRAYRRLIREYFEKGCKWSAAPKPLMTDALYNWEHEHGRGYCLTEVEPVFDAADILRCGTDLFVQPSHVTNRSGIEWLRRHFAPTYNVHVLETADSRAVHIDATFCLLAPGKVLINPERVKKVPDIFLKAKWDILEATVTTASADPAHRWLDMNILSLDEKRILVEAEEYVFQDRLKKWGFEPIPVPFKHFYRYGGAFHCSTCDIRRRGTLQSYF
jgi:glycine amidinotransferase